MKTNYLILLLFVAFSSLNIQCKEDEKGPVLAEELAKLPKATSNGNETFGCLLNGYAWPGGRKIYDYTLHIAYYNYNGGKRFNVMCYTSHSGSFPMKKDIVNIVTDDIITGPGEYIISLDDNNTDFVAIKYKEIRYNSGFPASFGQKLHLNITRLDSINRIISGNFRISLLDYTGTKAMHLEYGRFDSYY
ncbi:MAG: hypothetical protein KBB37_00150 [Bacteroidia bacterium]|nr:hypothetical protein [Bacteroidia bacterium]MBP9723380.1 hypothetical protein [Bacteroidia bacterium]